MADILEQPEDNNDIPPVPRIKPLSAKALQADRVSVAINRGLMGNPADAAKRKEYSKELGVEPHEIRDLNEAKAEVIKKRSQMDQLIETNPGLARYLLNNPITPELASEDLPALHKIARAWRRTTLDPIVQVFGKGSSMLAQSAVGAADIATRFIPGKKQDLGKTLEDAGFKFKELDQILEGMLSPEQQLANMKRAEQKTFTGALEAMVESPSAASDMVLSSLAAMYGGGALGAVLKKVAPAASAAVAAALGESVVITGGLQEKIRQESETGSTTEAQKSISTLAGTAAGGVSAISNVIARKLGLPDIDAYIASGGLKNALSTSGVPPSLAKVILSGTVVEGAEEMSQSALESVAENVALGKQWDDGLGAAVAQGLVAGSLTQLGFSPMMIRDAQNTIEDNISRERHKAASDALQNTFKAMRAEGTRDMLAKVGEAVSESNLRNLSTDAFAEFVDHMTEDSDVDAVYVPVEKLDEVLLQSGMTESELTDKMPEVADNIRIARATKGDVRIPVKDYLVNFAGTPTEKSLLDHLKIDPEGMTFAESQEFMQSQKTEFEAQAQQIIAADQPVLSAEEYAKQPVEGKTYKQYLQEHPDQNAVIEADSKNVERVIVGELNKAGRFNREANAVYAVPFREFFRTAAIRETRSTGKLVTPTEIYERYPLKYQMRGETPTATPDTLTQPVTAATPEDFKTENIQDILKNGNWMIVAATNPNASTLTDEENEKLHAKLLADLDARGLKYEVVYGRYPGDATEMPSVLVYDVDNATARDFANRYDQDSVLVRDGFIYRDGQVKPHLGNVTTYSDTASAFSAGGYTRVPSTGAIFSVDFDWNANDRYQPLEEFYTQPGLGEALPPTIDVDGVERPTTNSEGRAIHTTREGIHNFWRWFGDSKVVDEEGRPLVVYHAANTEFDEFDENRRGENFSDTASLNNFFFSTDKEDASLFGPIVKEFYLKSGRLKEITDDIISDETSTWLNTLRESDPEEYDLQINTKQYQNSDGINKGYELAINSALLTGYESTVYENEYGIRWFTVRRPTQIKSATGNTGSFAPDTGNVLLQSKPGSMTLIGVHYSHEKRTVLDGTKYGTGLTGKERDRVLYGANTDDNIKTRVDFYTDTGNGVTPESGLGGVKHEVLLTDIYDASINPLNLSYPPTWDGGNTFEQQVLANGFKGYFVNQGKQGRVVLLGEAARAVPVPTPEQLLAEKYQATQQYFQPVVSTRTPKPVAGRADPHLSSGLAVDLDALYASDNMTTKLAGIVNLYDGFIPSTGTDPQEVLESFINQVEQNLDWLYRQVPPEVVARSRQWYDGGRVIVDRLVDRYAGKYTPAQMAAALALLSPQTAWDKNVSLSERTVDIWTNQQDTEWSKDMSKTLKRLIDKIRKEEKPAVAKVKIAKLKAAEGFKLSELATDYARGVWVRVYDETYNPRGYRKLSPEGGFLDFALKSDGITIDPASWLSFTNIGKVVGVLRDASMPNISRKLGGNHKVRNFYNNLIAPSDPLSVTIDTHAVAAGHLLPLGSSSYEVKVALGSTVSSDPQGLSGSYVLYTEAYRRVAAKYGLLPRELQSIAWEALRGLFTPAFKTRYQKDEALQAQFRELTEKLRIGETTHAEVAERIKDIAGGIQNPSWYGSGPRLDEGDPGSSYTGELLGARGSEGAIRSRARSGGPEGVPTLGLFEAVGLAAQQRAAAVNTNRPGGGTAAFFTKMTLGLDGKPGVSYRPVLALGSEHVSFIQEYSKHRGNFDSHIRASIPGFGEVQVYTGQAIVDAYPEGANVLDIGASEGSWAKTITALSGSKIKTDSLEPLEAMAASFQNISTVEGARLLPQAFGDTGWVEEETGFVVEPFAPEGKYDVVHEAMTFQFIDKDRGEQIDRVKRYMSPDGIYLTEEKFANDGSAAYKEREALKDRYKARYFTSEAIADKAKEVLTVGMNDLMVEQQSLEATLKERFKYVVQYWSAANFGGYIASDSAAAVKNFLDKLPSTESEYSNQPPHRIVKGRLKLGEVRKVSAAKLDDVLNQSSFYSALEREIGGLNKIANKEGAVKPDQAIKWIEARQKEGKFKKEEVEAVGVLDWLQTRTGDVKVAAVEDFVRQNGVQLEVMVLGDNPVDEDRVYEVARESFFNNFEVYHHHYYESLIENAVRDTAREMLDDPEHLVWELYGENWHDTEGLESYSRDDVSELARRLQESLSVYEIIGEDVEDDIRDEVYTLVWDEESDYYLDDARTFLQEQEGSYPAEFEDYQLDGGENYREILFRLPYLDLRSSFDAPHFREELSENLIAHTRVNERFAKNYTPEQQAQLDEFEKQYAEWVEGNSTPEIRELLAARDKSSEDLRDAANSRIITPELEAEDPVLAEAADRNRRLNEEIRALRETRRAAEPKRPAIEAKKERVLFVEEVQSDWAQQGRDFGFILKNPPKLTADELEYEAIIARISSPENSELNKIAGLPPTREEQERLEELRAHNVDKSYKKKIKPDINAAPFVTDTQAWVTLVTKRLLRYAAENGFTRISWTTGAQQAERYRAALLAQVDEILYSKNKYGTYSFELYKNGNPSNQRIWEENVSADRIMAVFGKDIGEKIVNGPVTEGDNKNVIAADDLTVGGQGMKDFYDKLLPSVMTKVTKSLGGSGKVEIIDFTGKSEVYDDKIGVQQSIAITPAMVEKIMSGLPLFKGERGSFNPNTFITTLTDGSDKSTVIHEGGHFYLEALADMASRPDAPQQVKDDFRKTLDWFGIKGGDLEDTWRTMTLEQKRPFHEQWAQSFERYILEGKAPTVEMQPVFARFRAWMLNVYKSIKEFLKQNPLAGKLNDDVRAIFDRLLATEEKITEMERARSMMPLFASADQAGVTQAKFEAYLAEGQAATDEAVSQLAARSLRDMKWASGARDKALRQLQREAKAKRKALTEEVAAEVAQEPITQARNFLLRGIITGDDGVKTKASTTFKLDRGAINELYPGIDLTRIEKMVSDAGMTPDAAAQMFGFSSGQELIDALLNEESTTDKIQGLVDQRMLERYGDLVDDRAIEAAADKAIHNRVRAKFLATGLAMLKGQPGTAKDLNKAARLAAEGALSAKKVRDITPGQYAAAERRANAEAIKRAAESPQSAVEAQRAALLNNHMARIARDIREEVEAGLRYVKKFDKKELRKLLGPDYVEQIDDLLSGFDFRKGTSLAQIDKMQSLRDWIEDQEAEGLDPAIDLDLVEALKTKSYKEMTIEEFRSLIDAVKQIEHLGRLKNKLLTAKDQKEFRATVDEAEQSIRDNANRTVAERETPSDVFGKVGKWVRQMFASHRKFNSVIREMDGFKNAGVMWRILARPMNEAGDREVEMRQQAAEQIAKLFGMLEKKDTVPGNLYSKKRLVPGTNISMTQEQRIMFGMNWGNEGNRQRLMDGGLTGRKALSAQEAYAILGTITKEEWDFIQGVLDYIGSYKDQIAALEKQLTGIEPKWIEASPIVTKFGTYRGGYFPAKYDADLSTRSEVLEAVNDLRMGMKGAFGSAATKNGYTKERSKQVIGRPILLSFNVISQHVSEVTHRLAWQPWLIDANRLLRALDEPIREHYGTEILRELRNTVLDIATGDVGAKNAMEAAINHLRTGSTIVGMGWRVTTALLQPSGLAQSWTRLGSRWATAGVARYLKNPLEAGRFVDEKSSLMRNRGITMQREINEVLNTLRSGDKVSAVTGSYFTMIGKMQRTVDIPTWIGAYEKHLYERGYEAAEGEEERNRMENEAIAIADQTVIDTQSGGQIKDLASIQRGSPVQKLFTNFYSYFSATYNLNVETVRKTNFRDPSSVGLMAVDLLLLNAAPVLFAVALKNMMKGGCDWGDTECLVEKVAQEQVSFLMGQMVVLREVAVAGQAVIGGDAYGYQGPAGLRFFSDLYKLGTQVEQGDADFAAFKAANSVAGALFHYPAGQINSTLDGILAIEDGRVEGVSILPALIAGAPKE